MSSLQELKRGDVVYVRDYAQDFHRARVWEIKAGLVCVVTDQGLERLQEGLGDVFPICFHAEDVAITCPQSIRA